MGRLILMELPVLEEIVSAARDLIAAHERRNPDYPRSTLNEDAAIAWLENRIEWSHSRRLSKMAALN
jgi:signal recognition particle subunit SEC65